MIFVFISLVKYFIYFRYVIVWVFVKRVIHIFGGTRGYLQIVIDDIFLIKMIIKFFLSSFKGIIFFKTNKNRFYL
jgi:hypothetical protein